MKKALLVILLAAAAGAACALYYIAPGPLAQDTNVIFRRGERFQSIADDLGQAGVVRLPLLFKAVAWAVGDARKFKAGEYHFTAGITPREVIAMIAQGKVVIHKVTVAEGLSVREILPLLQNDPALEGAVPAAIKEGSLLPETYHFMRGDQRQQVIAQMQKNMMATLTALWEKRKPGLPFTDPQQALTLASIVENETGIPSERGRVAAVFINRLNKGMRLQSDPTVAYGIEQQKNAPLGRSLTSADLQTPTPYNTYTIDGLPPGPVANPGRASLEATLNPPDTNELYFVATGTGGHRFAATLEEHNKNVQEYRALRKAQ